MAEIEKQKDKEKEKLPSAPVQIEQEVLPKTIVRRLVKDKLSQLSTDTDISLLRDSLLAFSESARIFIHYLSATANDICKESKRQTINAEDVFKALEEIEFPEFIEPLRASLEVFRQRNSKRKSGSMKSAESNKKAKLKEPVENGKAKMKEQPSDTENEDGQAGEQPSDNENEDGQAAEHPSDNENEDGQAEGEDSGDE
ncbi:DNA polymerase II subunit B4 [Nicotiana tabacum]|uniref:DNA polymerase II subunit B4 n=2 Tax=Nicotiana TaxID=4085 RepID=A0A1S4BH59_TOBAC|nr:PREDICTED: DNA polymerase epsilon subunit 3 [Nicotiana sylvestris]XP_016488182.1 PREDICTED: DNA polymerase epsilon subunit 3-like [Nicotiana tabacum]